MKKLPVYISLILFTCNFPLFAQSQEAVKFRMSYNFIHDGVSAHGVNPNKVSFIQNEITLSGKNNVSENNKMSSGSYQNNNTNESSLGKDNRWAVINKNTLVKTTDRKTHVIKTTLTIIGDMQCKIKVSYTLRSGYKYFVSRNIKTNELAQWTNPRFSDERCEIL